MTTSQNHADNKENQWNLESLYPSSQSWEQDFACIDEALKQVTVFRGRLGGTPDQLKNALEQSTKLERLVEKLYSFAHHRSDEDTRKTEGQAIQARIGSKLSQVSAELAWFEPELLALPESKLQEFISSPDLKDYRRKLEVLKRAKAHQRTAAEEEILSLLSDPLSAAHKVFNLFENADLKFPSVRDSKGQEHPLDHSSYRKYLESRDRTLRQNTMTGYHGQFFAHRNTLAASLEGAVKQHVVTAKIRKYPSAIEASLFSDQIPLSVYNGLIEVAHEGLPLMDRTIRLRKKALGISDYRMSDNDVAVGEYEPKEIPYDEGFHLVAEAVRPLGSQYVQDLLKAKTDRWVDVYPRPGKCSGAYSGGCYDSHPFILMNYNGRVGEVFTLAHELGHSMHSLYSRKYQPYSLWQYPIFLAEIASTTNELLLYFYLMKNTTKREEKEYYLNYFFKSFRGTFFRQTQFAEFERDIHAFEEQGEPLTAQKLCDHYLKLITQYYPNVQVDDGLSAEWARIPHFYYDFYVYKYATSYAAAHFFARKIYDGDLAIRDKYLEFLKSGNCADPLITLQKAGLDLSTKDPLRTALKVFESALDEYERL